MRTENLLFDNKHPVTEEIGEGWQKVYKFKNNYGASVVWFKINGIFGSYTNEREWELAVIKFAENSDDFDLCYDTEITSDVIGHLSEEEVDKILNKIENLKK